MNYIEVDKKGLKFNLNTLRIIGELAGVDPFKFSFDSSTYAGLIEGVKVIAHAAMISAKKDVAITSEEVSDWLGELGRPELMVIVNAYTNSLKTTAAGESSGDTQQAAHV